MSCSTPLENEDVMPRRRRFAPKGICVKCKTNRGRLIIRHAAYCKECFEPGLISKFRGILDPTINFSDDGLARGSLKAPGNLLIGFSGGIGSTVLIDLIKRCYLASTVPGGSKGGRKHPRRRGRPWERIFICYIDCSTCYDTEDRTDEVRSIVADFDEDVLFLPLRLDDCFQDTCSMVDLSNENFPISHSFSSSNSQTPLKNFIASLPTPSSRESAIKTLVRLLLLRTARSHNCSHVLVGTTLTALSVNLITSVAGGSGFTIGLEKGEDWKDQDLHIVRLVLPLREISMKECAAYSHWRDLSVIPNRRTLLSSHSNAKESIGGLTKDFIYGLERDYPSTVNAIIRTCNKLVSNSAGLRCALCERPTQGGNQAWKERVSIRQLKEDSTVSDEKSDSSHLAPNLCYACNTTLSSRSNRRSGKTTVNGADNRHVLLPSWVDSNLKSCLSRPKMEEQIRGFLLEKDSPGAEMN